MRSIAVRTLTRRRAVIAVLAFAAFAAGVCLGRQTAPTTTYDGFLMPVTETELDRQFLTMRLEQIENSLNALEETQAPDMPGIPTFRVNPATGKIEVFITIHGAWADKESPSALQSKLKDEAQAILISMRLHLPGLSQRDVQISFTKVNLKTGQVVNEFAQFRNGELKVTK